GRPWWGCSGERARMWALSTAEPLPVGVVLLAVEGDGRWDRISPEAMADLPQLFAASVTARPKSPGARTKPARTRL
ncbi:MAG: hypothetical protein K2V38_29730, partial [Gemmataceae bacterium]|nr:hypothetical protein [Gemmataceae bacterium]